MCLLRPRASVFRDRADDRHLILPLTKSRHGSGQEFDSHRNDGRAGGSGGNLNRGCSISGGIVGRIRHSIILPACAGVADEVRECQPCIALGCRTGDMLKGMVRGKSNRRPGATARSGEPSVVRECDVPGGQWVRRCSVSGQGIELHEWRDTNRVYRVIRRCQRLQEQRRGDDEQSVSDAALHVAYSASRTTESQLRSSSFGTKSVSRDV